MPIESVVKEPDLWAECIKNLVTVGSALILTAYVAFAQFSHQSGKLSALQSKAFFKYVLAPWPSGLGFILLLLACGLTSDNAGLLMKGLCALFFLTACLLHGFVIVLMYEWSRGSNVSNAFVGSNARARLVRALLFSKDEMTFDQKAVHVVQHFKVTGKYASAEDKKFSIRLLLATVRQSYAACAKLESMKVPAKDRKAYSDKFFGLLLSVRHMHSIAPEEVEHWYSPDLARSLVIRTRLFGGKQGMATWLMHDHLIWLNQRLSEKDQDHDYRYKAYFEALISEAANDYPNGIRKGDDSRSLLNHGLYVSIFDAIGLMDFRSHSQVLSRLLEPSEESCFGRFTKSCFLDFARESLGRNKVSYGSPLRNFCSSHLPEVSLNHLLRLIQLERDVLNTHVDTFVDRVAKTAGGDGIMTLVNPSDDIAAEMERIGSARRRAAEKLFIYAARFSFAPAYLSSMQAALGKKRSEAAAASDEKMIARVDAALTFLAEHYAFVRETLAAQKPKG